MLIQIIYLSQANGQYTKACLTLGTLMLQNCLNNFCIRSFKHFFYTMQYNKHISTFNTGIIFEMRTAQYTTGAKRRVEAVISGKMSTNKSAISI